MLSATAKEQYRKRITGQVSYHFWDCYKSNYSQGSVVLWRQAVERTGISPSIWECIYTRTANFLQSNKETEKVQPYKQMVSEYLTTIFKSKNENLTPALHLLLQNWKSKPRSRGAFWELQLSKRLKREQEAKTNLGLAGTAV